MKRSFWVQLDVWARNMTPFGLTLILVIISMVPMHVPGYARVVPLFSLMAVYHWTVFRPELMPAFAVFVIGLLQDILSGAPIGVHALVFLVVYGLVLSQRRFLVGKSFTVVWLGFSLVASGAAVLSWALVSAYDVTLVDPKPVFFQYLMTLGTFPLLGWLLLRWQSAILGHK